MKTPLRSRSRSEFSRECSRTHNLLKTFEKLLKPKNKVFLKSRPILFPPLAFECNVVLPPFLMAPFCIFNLQKKVKVLTSEAFYIRCNFSILHQNSTKCKVALAIREVRIWGKNLENYPDTRLSQATGVMGKIHLKRFSLPNTLLAVQNSSIGDLVPQLVPWLVGLN